MIQLQFENCVEPKSLSTFRGEIYRGLRFLRRFMAFYRVT